MLRITIELWPHGTQDKSRHILLGKMDLYNDGTGDVTTGNYAGRVFAKGSDHHIVRKGVIENFPRTRLNAWHLLARMLKNMGYA